MDLFFVDPTHGVWIGSDLYCKTPDCLRYGLTELRTFGYLVESRRDRVPSHNDRVQMECRDEPLWEAKLPGIHLAQCLACRGFISQEGAALPDRRCEFCGEPTMTPVFGASHVANYKLITFWRGKAYDVQPDGQNPSPYPEQMWVYETWRWMPWSERNRLPRHLFEVGSEDEPLHTDRLTLYVEHFTTLNIEQWHEMLAGLGNRPAANELLVAATAFCRAG